MKEPYDRGRPYVAGETVTAGKFVCLACSQTHVVSDGAVVNLPVCPRCQGDEWKAA